MAAAAAQARDPLTLLRECGMRQVLPQEKDGQVVFENEWAFDASAETAYRSGGKSGVFYRLDSLLLLLQCQRQAPSEYLRAAITRRIEPVEFRDRDELLKFLKGSIATSSAIDQQKLQETARLGKRVRSSTADVPASSNAAAPAAGAAAAAAAAAGVPTNAPAQRQQQPLQQMQQQQQQQQQRQRQAGSDPRQTSRFGNAGNSAAHNASVAPSAAAAAAGDEAGLAATTMTDPAAAKRARREYLETDEGLMQMHETRERLTALASWSENKASKEKIVQDEELLTLDRTVVQHLKMRELRPFGSATPMQSSTQDFGFAVKFFDKEESNPSGDRGRSRHTSSSGASHRSSRSGSSHRRSSSSSSSSSSAAATASGSAAHKSRLHSNMPMSHRCPIILVPQFSVSTVLTMLNIEEFLVNGRFVPVSAEEGALASRQLQRRGRIEVVKQLPNGKYMQFQITDNAKSFESRTDWERVVAIFVHGATWQFRGWRYSDPVDLFQRALGVHVMFDDTAVPSAVKNWNVSVLKISRTRRFLDSVACRDFWTKLHDFLRKRKSHLCAINELDEPPAIALPGADADATTTT